MRQLILLFEVLSIVFLMNVSMTSADPVRKNSIILKEVRDLRDSNGNLVATERIYHGGISGQGKGIALTELRAPEGMLTFENDGTIVIVKVIPLVAEIDDRNVWRPVFGMWNFKTTETNSYEGAIHVKSGGDLDIAFQSSGMRWGNKKNIVHYGLSGNPHAISLSRKRLKSAFANSPSPSDRKRVLSYQPPDDVILIQMQLTPQGFLFQPIFDYEVKKP